MHKGDLRSNKGAECGASWLSRIRKLEVLTNSCFLGVLESDGWEGLDVEVGSFRARLDELSGQGEDGLRSESCVESGGHRLSTCGDSDESLVASLDSDDGCCGGQDILRRDQGCGSKVGRNADRLENTGGLNHGLGTGEGSIEVVLASLDWLRASGSNGGDESGHVSSFGLAYTHERLDLRLSETQGGEVGHGELRKSLLVELRLEVLSSKSASAISTCSQQP